MRTELDPDPDPDHITGFDRRQIIRSTALLGLGGLAASALGSRVRAQSQYPPAQNARGMLESYCQISPSQTLGPYWLNLQLLRQDITEGQPGQDFYAMFRVLQLTNGECRPVQGAVVDIWHCNAMGVYSGFANQGTSGQTWLRGIQITGADGVVTFRTIYPGWYPGRTTHIHLRVLLSQQYHLTSQTYFDDAFSTQTYLGQPYATHGPKPVANHQDGIFDEEMTMPIFPRGPGAYIAAKSLVVV